MNSWFSLKKSSKGSIINSDNNKIILVIPLLLRCCYAGNIIRKEQIHLPGRQENAAVPGETFHLIKPIKALFIGGP